MRKLNERFDIRTTRDVLFHRLGKGNAPTFFIRSEEVSRLSFIVKERVLHAKQRSININIGEKIIYVCGFAFPRFCFKATILFKGFAHVRRSRSSCSASSYTIA